MANYDSLLDALQNHSEQRPDEPAFSFLKFGSRGDDWDESSLSYAQLRQRAIAIAARVQAQTSPGDRVLLLVPAGLDFVSAFLGCLIAQVIAVPAPVPSRGHGMQRLRGIIADCGATVALSHASIRDAEALWPEGLGFISCEPQTDDAEVSGQIPAVSLDGVALLQYSSGSTGAPKGVKISHGNLVSQAEMLSGATSATADSRLVSWLPPFHDMGLIVPIVTALYTGFQSFLMAPESFVLRPVRWLKAIAHYRAHYSVAPNFAYELCVDSVADKDIEGLDLSCWTCAANSAEPVRARTVQRFAERYRHYGLPENAMRPAYGLAEATLMVTVSGDVARARTFDASALEQHRVVPAGSSEPGARRLASSGMTFADVDVAIVDPDAGEAVAPGHVGEVWVAGSSVASGYWNNAEASAANFGQTLAEKDGQQYMRTGDLGFIDDDHLYICGRLKDLIVIRGSNHHASDIEHTVESSHAMLNASASAVFSVESDERERLVVVQELSRKARTLASAELDEIVATIRRAVSEQHQVSVSEVVLMLRGLPRTTSGKVRRQECRREYLADELHAHHVWQEAAPAKAKAAAEPVPTAEAQSQFKSWLIEQFAAILGQSADDIASAANIGALRLEPTQMYSLVRALEKDHAIVQPISILGESESIDELAAFLADLAKNNDGNAAAVGGRLLAEDLNATQINVVRHADQSEPVAIIGIGCRFPGADDAMQFWGNLCAGVESVGDVPPERWDIESTYDENPLALGKMNTRRGGFLSGIENFDRQFFQVPIREAIRVDPAHRLLLEVCWESLEDAGVVPESMNGSQTGVFVGISGSDYAQLQFGDENLADAYAGVGSALTNAAGRISHFLNLRGPAIAVDTACSSSLSAIHMACASIRSGECEMALAGGVNIILSPLVTMSLSKAGMMAPDGRCKTFDTKADGYVRSEGVGLALLKPLSRALEDGDSIYAVVKGSASNQDGRSTGIAAPNGAAQQRVVLAACRDAGVEPGDLDYIEAHGTGTAIGDPIEVNALGEVLKIGAKDDVECPIGSVKTNIGHAESAAGIASFVKATMVLKHRAVPPSLNLDTPNPLIPFDDYRLRVQTELGALEAQNGSALAGINSFGISGTNVHVVLQEHRDSTHAHANADATVAWPQLIPISANTVTALKANASRIADHIEELDSTQEFADCFHTLARHRAHLSHRLTVTGSDPAEVCASLRAYAAGELSDNIRYQHFIADSSETPSLAFVYSGQGSQWWAMGRRLFQEEPIYRAQIERVDAALVEHTGWSMVEVLMADESDSLLDQTAYAQPAIFAVQYALTKLLAHWGIEPAAVAGHSVGEVTAACVSGALSLEQSCRLIAVRASLMQESTGNGSMASVETELEALEPYLAQFEGCIDIAAINGPGSVVVSGDAEPMQTLLDELERNGVIAMPLPVRYAFHSAQMEPYSQRLVDELAGLCSEAPTIPMVSTVTGGWVSSGDLGAEHWGANMRHRVAFRQSIETLAEAGHSVFLEVGPHPVLSRNMKLTLQAAKKKGTVLSTLQRNVDDRRAALDTFANLHTNGISGDWGVFVTGGRFSRHVPRYSWDRQRYWLDAPHHEARRRLCSHPLLSVRMPIAQATWQSHLDAKTNRYLLGAQRGRQGALSNGVFIELMCAALVESGYTPSHLQLNALDFGELAAVLSGGDVPPIQTTLRETADGAVAAAAFVQHDTSQSKAENWARVVNATVESRCADVDLGRQDLEAARGRAEEEMDAADLYMRLGEIGFVYDAAVRVAERLWIGEGAAVVGLAPQLMDEANDDRFVLHPLLFEAVEQACRFAMGSDSFTYDLHSLQSLRVRSGGPAAFCYARVRETHRRGKVAVDAWLTDAEGRVLVAAESFVFEPASIAAEQSLAIPANPRDWLLDVKWVPVESAGASIDQGAWLLLADQLGVAQELATQLRAAGHRCVLAAATDGDYERVSPAEFRVRPGHIDDLHSVLEAIDAKHDPINGIVHLWSIDAAPVEQTNVELIEQEQTRGVVAMAHAVQACAALELAKSPRIWVVTGGSQPLEDGGSIEVSQAPVWGFGKGVAIEHPELKCTRVDLSSGAPDTAEVAGLVAELVADGPADQVAFRADLRFEPRLQEHAGEASTDADDGSADASKEAPDHAFAITWTDADVSGEVAGDESATAEESDVEAAPSGPALAMAPANRTSLGFDDVEIRVTHADLCTQAEGRDGPIDMRQCIGTVIGAGIGVEDLKLGDSVYACQSHTAGSHLVVSRHSVVPLPEGFSMEAMASVRAYLAASFALQEMVGLAKGQSVLIHAADCRRGRAAIALARKIGATVYATAADPGAMDGLRALRAHQVFDLSSVTLVSDLDRLTKHEGVDVVVNCAGGRELQRIAGVASGLGHFVDLSGGAEVSLDQPNASITRIDVDSLFASAPRRAGAVLTNVCAQLVSGSLRSEPIVHTDLAGLAEALDDPASASIVLDMPMAQQEADAATGTLFEADATYIVTGGLGGLGLTIAERMVQRGARNLVLLGRSSPSLIALDLISQLRQVGTRCEVMAVDVASSEQVHAMVAKIRAEMPPLKGIIHAAGILDNGLVLNLDEARIRGVMPAKVQGAWHLHTATADDDLDFFVMFSSLASLIGSHGQSNYSAANAFLDALADHRKRCGLAGSSVAWGPWDEVGMAADAHNMRRLKEIGLGAITPSSGLGLLEEIISERKAGLIGAIPMNWALWSRYFPYVASLPFFSQLVAAQTGGVSHARITTETIQNLDPSTQFDKVLEAIRGAVCQSLKLELDEVPDEAPLTAVGLDSIISLEVKSRIESTVDVVVQTNTLLKGCNIRELSQLCLEQLLNTTSDAEAPAAAAEAAADDEDLLNLDELSQEEIAELLEDLGAEPAAELNA